LSHEIESIVEVQQDSDVIQCLDKLVNRGFVKHSNSIYWRMMVIYIKGLLYP